MTEATLAEALFAAGEAGLPIRQYRERVAPRMRIVAFGSAAALVVAGSACAALVGGVTGEVLTIVLVSAGLAGGLLLVFLEIGLGEERDLARDQGRKRKRDKGSSKPAGDHRCASGDDGRIEP